MIYSRIKEIALENTEYRFYCTLGIVASITEEGAILRDFVQCNFLVAIDARAKSAKTVAFLIGNHIDKTKAAHETFH